MPRFLLFSSLFIFVGILSIGLPAFAQKLYFEQQQEVTSDDIASGDLFGWSASLSGDLAAFGALADESRTGAVYLFRRSGTTWTQEQKITASDGEADDVFGSSVAAGGDYVIVGAGEDSPAGHNSGSAYIFHTTGEGWYEQKKIVPSDHILDDKFGEPVSISGDSVAVSSRFHDDFANRSGSIYVFVRDATDWTEQQKINPSLPLTEGLFGSSVDITGDQLIGGQPGGATNTGKAFVFVRSASTWSEVEVLIPSDGAVGDEFGRAVGIEGDTAVVGAPLNDTFGGSSGAAYVYMETSPGVWTEIQKLTPPGSMGGDQFGVSVAISGDTILVGADGTSEPEPGCGAVYVFVRDGNSWVYEARWFVEDVSSNQTLGRVIALDGDTGVSGAIGDSDPGFFTGTGYIFSRTSPTIPGQEPGSHVEGWFRY